MKHHASNHPARGPGRPPLPAGEARTGRIVTRLNDADQRTLTALAAALGTSEADAMRVAMRKFAAALRVG